MRDFRDAKTMAHTLRASLDAIGFQITVSQSLELIARTFGLADWNTLSAAIAAQPTAIPASPSPSPASTEGPRLPEGDPDSPLANPLSRELESAVSRAHAYAREHKHEGLTVEHLLLSLLDDADAAQALAGSGTHLEDLKKKLTDLIDRHVRSQTGEGTEALRPAPTVGFQRVLQRAVVQVRAAGRGPVRTVNVLVAMFSEKESRAFELLTEQGVTREKVMAFIHQPAP